MFFRLCDTENMMIAGHRFEARLDFLIKKMTETYTPYVKEVFADEKFDIAQKLLWQWQLSWLAESSDR